MGYENEVTFRHWLVGLLSVVYTVMTGYFCKLKCLRKCG
jgi:hypothetical protein